MSFSTDMAGLVAGQLSRFVTLNRHQLAGQVANLDFWLAEVRHVLTLIDGYGVRFVRLDAAQRLCIATTPHKLVLDLYGDHFVDQKMSQARRVPDCELQKARRAVVEATTRFLERCERELLLSDAQVRSALRDIGVTSARS